MGLVLKSPQYMYIYVSNLLTTGLWFRLARCSIYLQSLTTQFLLQKSSQPDIAMYLSSLLRIICNSCVHIVDISSYIERRRNCLQVTKPVWPKMLNILAFQAIWAPALVSNFWPIMASQNGLELRARRWRNLEAQEERIVTLLMNALITMLLEANTGWLAKRVIQLGMRSYVSVSLMHYRSR